MTILAALALALEAFKSGMDFLSSPEGQKTIASWRNNQEMWDKNIQGLLGWVEGKLPLLNKSL